MHVTVTLPTYANRESIFRLMDSLAEQSHKDFNVIVFYKVDKANKEIIGRLKEYKSLDIEMVAQITGVYAEAINMAYHKADGEIGINTDDDAYVSKNWIKDHVEVHRKHPKIGMATGNVIEAAGDVPVPLFMRLLNEQKWRINNHTLIDRPMTADFDGFGEYLGCSGMVVDTGRRYSMGRTIKQHGVNMSWKHDALHDFKFACYGRGICNEQAAALEAIRRGYETIWFDGGIVHHPLQESTSRGRSIMNISEMLTAENVMFAYYIEKFVGYKIDLGVLRLRTRIDDLVSRAMTMNMNKGYNIGYNLVTKALEGNWKPERVREVLFKAGIKASD